MKDGGLSAGAALAVIFLIVAGGCLLLGIPAFLSPVYTNSQTGALYDPEPDAFRLYCITPAAVIGFWAVAAWWGRRAIAEGRVRAADFALVFLGGLVLLWAIYALNLLTLSPENRRDIPANSTRFFFVSPLAAFGFWMAAVWWARRRGPGRYVQPADIILIVLAGFGLLAAMFGLSLMLEAPGIPDQGGVQALLGGGLCCAVPGGALLLGGLAGVIWRSRLS